MAIHDDVTGAVATASDTDMAMLLAAVQAGDEQDTPVDNQLLADGLKWSLDAVAACLSDAKSRSFIWGSRSGQRPAPWYTELELTVQGRRFLTQHRTA